MLTFRVAGRAAAVVNWWNFVAEEHSIDRDEPFRAEAKLYMSDAEELQLLLHMSERHTSGYSHPGITAPAVNTSSDVFRHVSRQTRG